jgi:hypothetical protein
MKDDEKLLFIQNENLWEKSLKFNYEDGKKRIQNNERNIINKMWYLRRKKQCEMTKKILHTS